MFLDFFFFYCVAAAVRTSKGGPDRFAVGMGSKVGLRSYIPALVYPEPAMGGDAEVRFHRFVFHRARGNPKTPHEHVDVVLSAFECGQKRVDSLRTAAFE